ncbi:Ferredoxin-fold anticodon binding domain containing 1 [Balamuthia mandrillaris]
MKRKGEGRAPAKNDRSKKKRKSDNDEAPPRKAARKAKSKPQPQFKRAMLATAQRDTALESALAQLSSANPNPAGAGPYRSTQSILLVGEGNLSFAVALASAIGGKNITATTFDTLRQFREKYASCMPNLQLLPKMGATVYHGVDATKLGEQTWLIEEGGPPKQLFHRIVFNFPHTGASQQEAVQSNQQLLEDFFLSSRPFLVPKEGEVHVSLRTNAFYKKWNVNEVASRCGFYLKKTYPFHEQDYPGYENSRTAGDAFVREAPTTEGAMIFAFGAAKRQKKKIQTLLDNKNKAQTKGNDTQPEEEEAEEIEEEEVKSKETIPPSEKKKEDQEQKRNQRQKQKEKAKQEASQVTAVLVQDKRMGTKYYCPLCRIRCISEQRFNAHLRTPNHKAKEAKLPPQSRKNKNKNKKEGGNKDKATITTTESNGKNATSTTSPRSAKKKKNKST